MFSKNTTHTPHFHLHHPKMILATLFSPLPLLLLLFFSFSTLSFSHFVPTFPSPSKFHPELTTQLSRSSSSSSSNGLYETKFFTQTLDHFDYTPQSNHKFQQRYLFNDTHWGGANNNAPIFVYTGNEGNIEWFTQNTGFMFETAPRFQALLVFIEHRFYGKSVPFGGNREVAYANTSTLGYLSSTQALADYATLIIDLKKNISAIDSPVVVFGGSYGGMLAAWFRMKYPHVTIGALASSAPILHFPGLVSPYVFSDTIANDFRSESENCYNVIKSSWKQIEDAGKTDKGLKLLQKSFRLCKNYSSDDLEGWLQSAWTYTAMTDYPLDVVSVPTFPNFRFPNDEIRIRHMSPKSERCPPLSVLQTISAFAVRCKLESSLPVEQPHLTNLHASCFYELMTAVVLAGEEEIHLVAMPSKRKKFPCFWCYAVPKGLYNACLGMLNMRCLAIVFDLDETLIVANTMKSFEDRIDALRGWLLRETDPLKVQGMSAELKRCLEDRLLLKQYAENDSVMDNGRVYKVQMEEVPALSENHEKRIRPIVRLPEKNIVLTRINSEIRDTSVLVRLRPAWEDLRCYLTAKGRKRFEVYVCTMAERDYALEMWRLLDPEAHLIGSKQILDRVICVKAGSRKSLLNVFQDGMCHPKMAMVIDDRSKVWEDKDQPRVHVVPAFTPYYAPQAETASAVPVLCVARNVACNVRGCFFKEFDEILLQRIAEIFFEDDVVSLPHPPDVSNYLMSEDVPNGNSNGPINEGMNGAEVERRLSQPDDKLSVDVVTRPMVNNAEFRPETSQPTAGIIANIAGPGSSRTPILSQKPGLLGPPVRHDVNSLDRDHDMKRGLLTMRHGPDIRGQTSVEPPLMSKPPPPLPSQPSPSLTQSHGGWLVDDDISSRPHTNSRPFASLKEPNAVKSDKHQAQQKPFSHSMVVSPPNALLSPASQLKAEEAFSMSDLQRQNALSKSQLSEDGISPNHASSNGKDIQSEAGKLNILPSVAIGVLQEIGRRCCSKVEFKSIVSTSKDLQFSVEVLFTGEKIGVGMGRTRKDAQQQAAENALRCLAEKYVAHMEPQCRAVDCEFDKLSLGQENGFLWDEVTPESSEQQRKDGLPKESASEASDAETKLSTLNATIVQIEKRSSSPRLPQSIPNKRLKE